MENLIVVGNGISANIMYEYLRHDSRYNVKAFAADSEFIKESILFDLPVVDLKSLAENHSPDDHKVLLAVGYSNLNRIREEIFLRVKNLGFEIVRYIHPKASVFSSAIGEGAVIMPQAYVDVHSSIGDNSVVWGNCTVAHHAKIGSNCWMASGSLVSGGATVGDNSFLGIGATVVNDVKLGTHNILGANTLIMRNTEDSEVYINEPTKKSRLSSEQFLRIAKF